MTLSQLQARSVARTQPGVDPIPPQQIHRRLRHPAGATLRPLIPHPATPRSPATPRHNRTPGPPEPPAAPEAAEKPSVATASARATPPQLSTPPHGSLRDPGPAGDRLR